MIRNILFDWSGTLVDDLPAVWEATNYVFRQAGLEPLTLERFRAEFCLPFKKFYDRFTPNVPMAQLEEWFHSSFRQAQTAVVEIPHARQFLERCRQRGLRLFILSTMHPSHFQAQATTLGFSDFFERAYVGVMDKELKIVELLQENQLRPDETLFVGDMQHDVEAAKRGGVFSCAVLTGYTALGLLRASQPDLIVEHLQELNGILDEHDWDLQRPLQVPSPARQQPTVTVGALIFDSTNRVLMIRTHKWSNLWGIPGGKVRFGESCLDGLRRELKEETNLEVADIEFVLVQDCIHSQEFYRDAHFVLLNYTCRAATPGAVKLNEEAQEFRWTTPAAALELPLNQPTRFLIERVLARGLAPILDKAFIRP